MQRDTRHSGRASFPKAMSLPLLSPERVVFFFLGDLALALARI